MAEDKNINEITTKLESADFADALNKIYASRVSGTEDGYALITELITYIQTTISDIKAKVSVNDTTSDYLASKLVAGTNITLTVNSPGGNETITIDASGGGSSEWQILLNKLSNITQTVDYISLYADSVEVARVGDGVNPKMIVDPIGTKGLTTGYWFSGGVTGFAEITSNVIAVINNNTNNYNFQSAGIRAVGTSRPEINFSQNTSATNPVIKPRRISSTTGIGSSGLNELSLIALATEIIRCTSTGAYVQVIKSGATQIAAGANAGEMWKTSGHASLPDNVIMHGV